VKHVLLPKEIADGIYSCGASWGVIDLRQDDVEQLIVIAGYSKADRLKMPAAPDWLKGHSSAHVPLTTGAGVWYQADLELHGWWLEGYRRRGSVNTEFFRGHVNGWRIPPAEGAFFVLTVAPLDDGEPNFVGWAVGRESATPYEVEVVDDAGDLFGPLADAWPQETLADKLVTVVGAGSIGSAAAEALSAYALRRLALVDPDRLHSHNFARHRALRNEVGRLKVNAVADILTDRDADLTVERFPVDVIEDADVMRPVFARSACILVASDGIASRRAANHLACRAGVPIVLACVLEDGRLGEVIRVRPGVTACLLCSREQLAKQNVLNPEPSLDLGYGEGQRHLPMTAVGGDLDIVGKLAARAAVSTLLEDGGYLGERLPGDHGVIGLRPALDWEPEEPFDVECCLAVTWHPLGTPSPDCPSCGDRR
jgi:molybdopterin/thiamine biosynthesis adenylyltransferase